MAHSLNGFLILVILVISIVYASKIKLLDVYNLLVLLLLFAILIGLHGISHALLEKQYNYVPFN
jgi:hypothetical protein